MYALIRELYPICRSISGEGVRQSLAIIGRHVPLQITELPTGTEVLDWVVPNEWNIRGAWIQRLSGERVIDFARSNLHVLNYSTPVRCRISHAELEPHLHSLPQHPEWIPYRTSYYAEDWGFCLSQHQRDALTDPEYEICIDSTLQPGHLTYAECVVPGRSSDEIVLTTHICHPSLCNDNLSGIAVVTALLEELLRQAAGSPPFCTLRVLFVPGTIGSIAWLAQNRQRAQRIRHGLSLVCLGDASPFTYKRTLHGERDIDRVLAHALRASGLPHQVIDYSGSSYVLWAGAPGVYTLSARYTPYWRVDDPTAACVTKGHDGFVQIRVMKPGPVKVSFDVSAGTAASAVAGGSSYCLQPPAAPAS